MHENTLWVVPTTFTQDRKDQRVGEKSNLSLQWWLALEKQPGWEWGERNWRGLRGWEAAEAWLWEAGGCFKLHVEIKKGSRWWGLICLCLQSNGAFQSRPARSTATRCTYRITGDQEWQRCGPKGHECLTDLSEVPEGLQSDAAHELGAPAAPRGGMSNSS